MYYLLATASISTILGIASFILQVQRTNSYLHKKSKIKQLKNDYQNVIENFAEGILIASIDGEISYIN